MSSTQWISVSSMSNTISLLPPKGTSIGSHYVYSGTGTDLRYYRACKLCSMWILCRSLSSGSLTSSLNSSLFSSRSMLCTDLIESCFWGKSTLVTWSFRRFFKPSSLGFVAFLVSVRYYWGRLFRAFSNFSLIADILSGMESTICLLSVTLSCMLLYAPQYEPGGSHCFLPRVNVIFLVCSLGSCLRLFTLSNTSPWLLPSSRVLLGSVSWTALEECLMWKLDVSCCVFSNIHWTSSGSMASFNRMRKLGILK